jgi:hypothetical protein
MGPIYLKPVIVRGYGEGRQAAERERERERDTSALVRTAVSTFTENKFIFLMV